MGSERYAKEPLLFISQPSSGEVQATMQHHYRSSKMKQPVEERVEPKKVKRRSRAAIYNQAPVEQTETEESKTTEQQEPSQTENQEKGKKFKDMTVAEQLHYLSERPDYAPQVVCEYRTEERTYRGILLKQTPEVVTIRSGRLKQEFPTASITKIRIVGL